MDEKLYYDDQVITFEGSGVYGCHIDLNYEELKKFCDSKAWIHMVLFQNFYQKKGFDKVGKYGNSNPNYKDDWVDIDIDSSDKFNDGGSWNPSGSCQFPSVHVVETFFQKINTDDKPQFTIAGMQHYQSTKK